VSTRRENIEAERNETGLTRTQQIGALMLIAILLALFAYRSC